MQIWGYHLYVFDSILTTDSVTLQMRIRIKNCTLINLETFDYLLLTLLTQKADLSDICRVFWKSLLPNTTRAAAQL